MFVVCVLMISLMASSATSNSVNCSSKYSLYRGNLRKTLTDGEVAFLMVSADQESLLKSKVSMDEKSQLRQMISTPISAPTFLSHHKSKINAIYDFIRVQGFMVNGSILEDYFKFEGKFQNLMNRKQVYVYSREDHVKSNKFYFLEACRMEVLKFGKITVEKSSILIMETPAKEMDTFFDLVQKINGSLKVINIDIEEFKVKGLDICENAEFYVNGCIENPKKRNESSRIHLIILFCVIFFLILVLNFRFFVMNCSVNRMGMNRNA